MRRFFIRGMFILSGLTMFVPRHVLAATEDACQGTADYFLKFPTWYKYLSPNFDDVKKECVIQFSFTEPADYARVLLAIFEILLRVGGIAAVLFIVYGGFQYIISTGEPDKTAAARTTIINAVVGMFIAMLATVIVNLIGRTL